MTDRYVAVPKGAFIQVHADWATNVTADQCIVPEDRRIRTGLAWHGSVRVSSEVMQSRSIGVKGRAST